jgi:hypothetical protein
MSSTLRLDEVAFDVGNPVHYLTALIARDLSSSKGTGVTPHSSFSRGSDAGCASVTSPFHGGRTHHSLATSATISSEKLTLQ